MTIPSKEGRDFLTTVRVAQSEGIRIMPHLDIIEIIHDSNLKHKFAGAFPVRTGTLAVNEAPNVKFGKLVDLGSVAFEVPRHFQGKSNALLAVDHPHFTVSTQGLVLAEDDRVAMIEDYPGSEGSYGIDRTTGVPRGDYVDNNVRDLHHLIRSDGPFIGLIIRNLGFDYGRFVIIEQDSEIAFRENVKPTFGAIFDAKRE